MKWHSCSLQEMTREEQDLGPQGKNNMGKQKKTERQSQQGQTDRPERKKEMSRDPISSRYQRKEDESGRKCGEEEEKCI